MARAQKSRHHCKSFSSTAVRQPDIGDLRLSGTPFGPVFPHPDALPPWLFRRALDWPDSGWSEPWPRVIDPPRDVPKKVSRYGGLGQLECDLAAMADRSRGGFSRQDLDPRELSSMGLMSGE